MGDRLKTLGAALFLCLIAPETVSAQPAAPGKQDDRTALNWLVGSWKGAGTAMDKASEASLEVRPVLGGRFLEFRYRTGTGFEGRAFYRHVEADKWEANWFDSNGSRFTVGARLAGASLTADWGTAEARRGQTIYGLRGDGRLELVDSVTGRDGALREFARHMLKRSE